MSISKEKLIELLNMDLALEYAAAIQYIQHAAVMTGAQFGDIIKELRVHASEEIAHAITLADQIDFKIAYSHPEIMGGGEYRLMPTFPYYYWRAGDWLYGAPDGYVDGIIVIYTSAGTYRIFE